MKLFKIIAAMATLSLAETYDAAGRKTAPSGPAVITFEKPRINSGATDWSGERVTENWTIRWKNLNPPQEAVEESRKILLEKLGERPEFSKKRWRLLKYNVASNDIHTSEKIPQEDFVVDSYWAIAYNYDDGKAYKLKGKIESPAQFEMIELDYEPLPSGEEFMEAVELVKTDSRFRGHFESGRLEYYKPMPPILRIGSERAISIGLMEIEKVEGEKRQIANEIVSVLLKSKEIHRHPGGAPPSALGRGRRQITPQHTMPNCSESSFPAADFSGCKASGPGADCLNSSYVYFELVRNGVVEWNFTVTPPTESGEYGSEGAGIELKNVKRRGTQFLYKLDTPIITVIYEEGATFEDGSPCGPWRDWADEYSMFRFSPWNEPGNYVGIRPDNQVSTIMDESVPKADRDFGDWEGVAVNENSDQTITLTSELQAGWYRYEISYHFTWYGVLMPRWGFEAAHTGFNCVCEEHFHSVYWRYDFDMAGAGGDRIGRWYGGSFGWFPSETQGSNSGSTFQVRDNSSGKYVNIFKGSNDRSYQDAPFSYVQNFEKWDFLALKYNYSEAWDGVTFNGCEEPNPQSECPPQTDGWINSSFNSSGDDVVFWYGGHFSHQNPDPSNHYVGPTLDASW